MSRLVLFVTGLLPFNIDDVTGGTEMMSNRKEDYYTNTVEDAASFERYHARDAYYDDRPTQAECLQEEFEANLNCPKCGATYKDIDLDMLTCFCTVCKHEWELEEEEDY